MLRLFAIALVLAPLGGCAHQTPAERAAEAAERQRCGSLEIYPSGVTPPRPYRVLGPVSADYDGIPSHRDQMLRERACGLGADAVMDVRESNPLAETQSIGGAQASAQSEADGTAIRFTDTTPPTPPAPPPP